jgi:predicted TPR repeat methyltransferase
MWFLRKLMGNPKTVLDIGCGDGELMKVLVSPNWEITGIDIYASSIKKAKKLGIYKEFIQGDVTKTCQKLAKQKKKYDLVFCSQVIEHITKRDGELLLDASDKLVKKGGRIYFGTPRGFMQQPEVFIKGNPYQHHKSGWSIEDFSKRGYKVYGVGFMPVWSENGWARGNNKIVVSFANVLSYAMSPISFLFPSLASGMMAVKDIK